MSDNPKKSARRLQSRILRFCVYAAGACTLSVLLMLVVYILVKGLPHLTPELFSLHYNSENVSLFPALVNTVTMTFLSLLIAAPLGIFSAIYLVEYAKRGNKFVGVVRITAETLSGIPSIVYGLFGCSDVRYCAGLGLFSSGGRVYAGHHDPSRHYAHDRRSTQKSCRTAYREGSFGLGAGKLRTVFRIVLPAAMPGILAGIILSVGRIVGETAALIYTAGTVAQVPDTLLGSGRTLSVHMYSLWSEGLNSEQSYATAVVLLVIVASLNALSSALAKRLTGQKKERKKRDARSKA